MIPSTELGVALLCVTGDEPEVVAQRANEIEVTVSFLKPPFQGRNLESYKITAPTMSSC